MHEILFCISHYGSTKYWEKTNKQRNKNHYTSSQLQAKLATFSQNTVFIAVERKSEW